MHDIENLEERGVVSVAVVSIEFEQAAASQNASFAYDPAIVFVPPPIQDRADDEMRILSDRALEEILRAISETISD